MATERRTKITTECPKTLSYTSIHHSVMKLMNPTILFDKKPSFYLVPTLIVVKLDLSPTVLVIQINFAVICVRGRGLCFVLLTEH